MAGPVKFKYLIDENGKRYFITSATGRVTLFQEDKFGSGLFYCVHQRLCYFEESTMFITKEEATERGLI